MVIAMTTQNYCMVNEQTNVCENVTLWDGNPGTWQPPAGYLMLPQDTTPAKNWVFNSGSNSWELGVVGTGQIGFTWDGTCLVTNEPQPTQPLEDQAVVTGAQTL